MEQTTEWVDDVKSLIGTLEAQNREIIEKACDSMEVTDLSNMRQRIRDELFQKQEDAAGYETFSITVERSEHKTLQIAAKTVTDAKHKALEQAANEWSRQEDPNHPLVEYEVTDDGLPPHFTSVSKPQKPVQKEQAELYCDKCESQMPVVAEMYHSENTAFPVVKDDSGDVYLDFDNPVEVSGDFNYVCECCGRVLAHSCDEIKERLEEPKTLKQRKEEQYAEKDNESGTLP